MQKTLWAGRIVSAVAVLFLVMDGVTHLMKPAPVAEAFQRLGFPLSLSVELGIIELVVRGRLCDSAHVDTGRNFADRLSWRRRGHPLARSRSVVRHDLSDYYWRARLGWSLFAGSRLRALIPFKTK